LLTSGLTFGIFLGSLMATCLSRVFSLAQIAAGAWRIPFLIGGIFGFIAMWLRRWLKETPVFEEMQGRAALSREFPLSAVLKNHRPAIVTSIVSTWMLAAVIVVMILTFRIIWRSFSAVFGVTVTLTEPDTGRGPAYYANRITDLAKATAEACSMCVEESAGVLFDYAKYR
jgi:hypothetical protein